MVEEFIVEKLLVVHVFSISNMIYELFIYIFKCLLIQNKLIYTLYD